MPEPKTPESSVFLVCFASHDIDLTRSILNMRAIHNPMKIRSESWLYMSIIYIFHNH
jgi:hypothetical protein